MPSVIYPPAGTANVYINPRWIVVPVHAPDSVANCYINGTGVADFSDERDWDYDRKDREFHLVFKAESPLQPGDLVLPEWSMATVGLAHVDRSTDDSSDDSPWSLELLQVEVKAVMPSTTDLEVLIYGATASDVRIDRIAYQLDLLVYRQSLNRPKPRWLPWKTALTDVTRLVRH